MTAYPLWEVGDSLMAGAYGADLADFITAASGRDCVNTSFGGYSMANIRDDMLAHPAYAPRTVILWDGSEQPGYTNAVSYCDELQTGLESLGHRRFILIPACVPFGGDPTNALAIRAEMLQRWPGQVLDWRDYIPNNGVYPNADQFANLPTDAVHPSIGAMHLLTSGVMNRLALMEGPVLITAFQINAFQNNAFQIANETPDTHDGFDAELYRKLQKKLKRRQSAPIEDDAKRRKKLRATIATLVRDEEIPEPVRERATEIVKDTRPDIGSADFGRVAADILALDLQLKAAQRAFLEAAALEWERQDEEDIELLLGAV